MKVKTIVRLIAFAAILASVQSFALAQGARVGYTATDLDNPGGGGNRVYCVNLDNPGQTTPAGLTNVPQELEGFLSEDFPAINPTNSRLFGVGENPDMTSTGARSALVNLSATVCPTNGLGVSRGETGIDFGTEIGAAWDHISKRAFAVASDDLNPGDGTILYEIDLSTGMATPISINLNLYVDGLAVGGDGTLYASDGRLSDSLYRYNFDTDQFVLVGSFGVPLAEDTGLANYRGIGGMETNLYMTTEGDGANVGRLWTVNATTGALTLVGELRLAGSGAEVPEDIEGFDIPWLPVSN
jgi:hypothetical protein